MNKTWWHFHLKIVSFNRNNHFTFTRLPFCLFVNTHTNIWMYLCIFTWQALNRIDHNFIISVTQYGPINNIIWCKKKWIILFVWSIQKRVCIVIWIHTICMFSLFVFDRQCEMDTSLSLSLICTWEQFKNHK